ncbi:dihydroxy-acid dehydratase [Alienimonas chondri]|uniref:Dihydroxy-acid dehydratase n=1 Tax=Alienimonas chondri TaxID=2681879 RepID=A0ABX1VC86_9PLAN|nr:dihydroxy-acid dehydratase [Alienimonas chondri]NNJ25705.1 Dihydroxy-acid dehydratase [Alienimonas chondri]
MSDPQSQTPADQTPAAPPNRNSRELTRGWQKGVTAFYYGLGMTDADFDRPQVGIGTPLLDGNLCNLHAHQLAGWVREGCEAAGLLGFAFGTPAVSDNITQGHSGGRASLPSRNAIANAAEMVCSAHRYDGLIGLHCCDKNGPGFAMALARLNDPGLILSGGSILPGNHCGRDTTILDVYDCQAKAQQGAMTAEEADAVTRTACPGAGGCGINASFNTWAVACEAMGLSAPYSSSNPAVGPEKEAECKAVGEVMANLLRLDLRPRDILTKAALSNGMRSLCASGGSTNGVLHLLALAAEAGVNFTLTDIQTICRETPVLAAFAPRGAGTMLDLHKLGGTPVLLKHMLNCGLLDGSCVTVTGQTLAENHAEIADPIAGPDEFFCTSDAPLNAAADLQICFGNLAPGGVVFKVSSLKEPRFSGRALVFEEAKAVADAAAAGRITPGTVVVLRGLGPIAAGMPEVLVASAALSTPELDGKVAFLSDTRVSGVSHGAIGVHCAPEAAAGGPIGLVEDGDGIAFDLTDGTIAWAVTEEEAARRRAARVRRPIEHDRRYLAEFAATVSGADRGCVGKPLTF